MRRAGLYRLSIGVALLVALEFLCRTGIITPFTMPAPTAIVRDLFIILRGGSMMGAILKTLTDATEQAVFGDDDDVAGILKAAQDQAQALMPN